MGLLGNALADLCLIVAHIFCGRRLTINCDKKVPKFLLIQRLKDYMLIKNRINF